MTSLYQLSSELKTSIESSFDPETGELLESFERAHEMWSGKGEALAAYILDLEGDAAKAKSAMDRIKRLHSMYERKAEALRAYLVYNMRETGICKIKGAEFIVNLQVDRDESIELDDEIDWPLSLCNDPRPPAPSKTKIKAAILAGDLVEGARLVKRDRLTIR